MKERRKNSKYDSYELKEAEEQRTQEARTGEQLSRKERTGAAKKGDKRPGKEKARPQQRVR